MKSVCQTIKIIPAATGFTKAYKQGAFNKK
jgi:hypothetical protein